MKSDFKICIVAGTLTFICCLSFLPAFSYAIDPIDPFDQDEAFDYYNTSDSNVVEDFGGIIGLISNIGNWMFGILLALAVIFLIYAAFIFLTSEGTPAKIESAKNIIIYAIVAIVLGVIAKGVVMVIQTLVG